MPSGPVANWNRHQSKKAATPVDAIAASAGSRGNVGKLCPAGHGESDQSTGTGNRILRFPILISTPDPSVKERDCAESQSQQGDTRIRLECSRALRRSDIAAAGLRHSRAPREVIVEV